MRRSESAIGETRVSGSTPRSLAFSPRSCCRICAGKRCLKALLALIGFIGIFGFFANLATRTAVSGWFDDVVESW